MTRVSKSLVYWRHTCRNTVGRSLIIVSIVTRVSLWLVTWRNTSVYTVEKNLILVIHVKRVSLNLLICLHIGSHMRAMSTLKNKWTESIKMSSSFAKGRVELFVNPQMPSNGQKHVLYMVGMFWSIKTPWGTLKIKYLFLASWVDWKGGCNRYHYIYQKMLQRMIL